MSEALFDFILYSLGVLLLGIAIGIRLSKIANKETT